MDGILTLLIVLAVIAFVGIIWTDWLGTSITLNSRNRREAIDKIYDYNMKVIYDPNMRDPEVIGMRLLRYDDVLVLHQKLHYRSKSAWDYIHPDYHKILGRQDET